LQIKSGKDFEQKKVRQRFRVFRKKFVNNIEDLLKISQVVRSGRSSDPSARAKTLNSYSFRENNQLKRSFGTSVQKAAIGLPAADLP
jgi:hypothetical protein